jgi:hypothetical protein
VAVLITKALLEISPKFANRAPINPESRKKALKAGAYGKDAADLHRMAQEVLEISKRALDEALRSAPEILFICAAGNDDGATRLSTTISRLLFPCPI